MGFKGAYFVAGLLFAGQAMAAVNPNPAARVHAKQVGTSYYKFTSKLKTVVELNFTLNFNHTEGKATWDTYLSRVATDYGTGGTPAFTVKKFVGPGNGASNGLPTTIPTLADLTSGEVIVDNNISGMNQIPGKSAAFATAFETAVKTNGKSVLGFHGSGDGGTGWAFYTNDLHPVDYHEHGNQTAQPVYKNQAEEKHVLLDSLLMTGTKMDVPMGTDASGKEVKVNTTVRKMKNEWYRFGRNLLGDTKYGPLTTCFMRYDPTAIGVSDLPAQYKYAGGNLFTWQIKIGAGKALYIPPGHDNSELTTGDSFDGSTGDYERFVAQALFYLAGYDSVACTGTACNGVPIVDDKLHLTGKVCGPECATGTSLRFDKDFEFLSMTGKPFVARLTDVHGRLVATKSGAGVETVSFDKSTLGSGVYFMSVKVGNQAPVVRRYLVSPSMR